jgi:recombination protein RecT
MIRDREVGVMATNAVYVKKPDDIRTLISSEGAKKQFALALPKHLSPDRFVRVALTAINKVPKLAQCTQASLIQSLMDCSAMGLEPDGRKAHLIPYGDKCQLIVDYKGLVDLARRSGEIADIHADVVCKNDKFDYHFGTDSQLTHRPAIKERGEAVAAYSFVRLKDGSSSFEVMNVEEIEAIKKRSKAGSSGPWVTDWNEMAKKTVFRRHSKWLPVSAEFQEAMEKDYDTLPIDVTAQPSGKPDVEIPKGKSESRVSDPSDDAPCTPEQQKVLEDMKIPDDKAYEILTSFGVKYIPELTVGQAKKAIDKFSKVAFGKK